MLSGSSLYICVVINGTKLNNFDKQDKPQANIVSGDLKKISDASAKVSEISQECFGNIRTVKAFGTEDYQTQINMEKLGILYEEEKKKANFSAVHEFVMTGCMFGCMFESAYACACANVHTHSHAYKIAIKHIICHSA